MPLVFAGWTLFVWGGRLRNLAQEPGPIGDASRWSLVGSVAFTLLGLALVAATVLVARSGRGRGRAPSSIRPVLAPLVVLTIVIWLLRGVDIAIGDHSVGFIVVHLVLAVVSIALAVASWRAVGPRAVGDSEGAGPGSGRLPSKRWVSL